MKTLEQYLDSLPRDPLTPDDPTPLPWREDAWDESSEAYRSLVPGKPYAVLQYLEGIQEGAVFQRGDAVEHQLVDVRLYVAPAEGQLTAPRAPLIALYNHLLVAPDFVTLADAFSGFIGLMLDPFRIRPSSYPAKAGYRHALVRYRLVLKPPT